MHEHPRFVTHLPEWLHLVSDAALRWWLDHSWLRFLPQRERRGEGGGEGGEDDQITARDADDQSHCPLLLCSPLFISAWLKMKEHVEQGGEDSC